MGAVVSQMPWGDEQHLAPAWAAWSSWPSEAVTQAAAKTSNCAVTRGCLFLQGVQ